MNNKIVLEGDSLITNGIDGETLLEKHNDGEIDLLVNLNGDNDLEKKIDGEIDLSENLDGEMGTFYRIGGGGGTNAVWGQITGDIEDQEDLQEALAGKQDTYVHNLGDFSLENYDWEIGTYLDSIGLVTDGFYKAHETEDDCEYYFIIERAGDTVYQEYWYSGDDSTYRCIRSGTYNGESWDYTDWDSIMNANNAYNVFAYKNHSHYIEETVNYSNILTYFNSFNLNKTVGDYKIVNNNGRNVYYLSFDYRYVSGLSGGYRLYQEYVTNADEYIHIRFGTRSGSSIVWGNWRNYPNDNIISGNYYSMDYIDNNYYTREEVDDLISGGGGGGGLIETTWADLVELRDNAELVKGAYYRITDYNFVTTKLGIQSGNHQFDIVLLAISESMLSESGYAVKHAGDHYFEREVTEGGIEWLYTLYADDYGENYGTEPIDHADDIHSQDVFCDSGVMTHPDTGDDVPVLYKTDSEEYTIDEPDYEDVYFYAGVYDFDGDEYDMWAKYERDADTDDWVFMQQYALTPLVVEDGELIVSPIPTTKTVPVNMNAWELKYCLDNDKELFDWAATDGKGVIYWLKDEFGNEAPYDFKNVMFQRKNITAVSNNVLSVFIQPGDNSHIGFPGNYGITCGNNNYYYYTFDTPYNAGNDSSLFGESAYNTIKPHIVDGKRLINNIVLGFANNNNIGNGCYDITIWGNVTENNLEYGCWNLLIVSMSQSIMAYTRSSTFFSIGTVTFDNGCSQNIGSMLMNSTLGESCHDNNLGSGNSGIRMGANCSSNTFGNYCISDVLEIGVSDCRLGNYCSYNNFGITAQYVTLPNFVRYCNFEANVSRITLTTTGGGYYNYLQYVTVCRGVSNLSAAPNRNQSYEQIYYKNGRVETAV